MTALAQTSGASRAELLRTLVQRQLLLRRKRSRLGMVWPLISPVLVLALYVFVFKRVFHVPIHHYVEYLFAGLLPWTLLTQSLGKANTSISSEADLIARAPFPSELLPISAVAEIGVFFLLHLMVFMTYLAIVGRLDVALAPLIVVPVAALLLLAASLAMLVSLIDVYDRDLRLVQGNILTVWFFLLPIVYRPNMAPSALGVLKSIDPMNMIVGQFRAVLYYGHIVRPFHMGLLVVIAAVAFVVARRVFKRYSTQIAKDV